MTAPGTITDRFCATAAKDAKGPDCVKTFFLPQKLHATGDDPRRHDGTHFVLLEKNWIQLFLEVQFLLDGAHRN